MEIAAGFDECDRKWVEGKIGTVVLIKVVRLARPAVPDGRWQMAKSGTGGPGGQCTYCFP